MIQSRRRQSSSVAISKSAIDDAFSTLQQLPEKPKENLSLKEAVEHLMDSIQAALAKGYSLEEVSEMLTGKGVEIAPSSLKYYLARSRREQTSTTPTRTRRPRKSKDATTDETEKPDAEPAIEASAPPELNGAASETEPKKRTTRRRTSKAESTDQPKTGGRSKTAAKTTSTRTRRKKASS